VKRDHCPLTGTTISLHFLQRSNDYSRETRLRLGIRIPHACHRRDTEVPAGLAVDSAGNVYIADAGDNRLRKFAPAAPSTRSRPRSPRPLRGGLLDTVRPVVILPAITLPVKRPVLMLSLMGAAGLQLCRPLRSLTSVLPPR
jgi:NHL repeat